MKRKRTLKDPLVIIGIIYLVCLLTFAIGFTNINGGFLKTGVPFAPSFTSAHFLGTDELGRDVIARLAEATRLSLTVGFIVQGLAMTIGIILGTIGAFGPKWISIPVMRFTDGFFAFPDILLAILIAGVLETADPAKGGFIVGVLSNGFLPLVIALGITAWPFYARLVFTQGQSVAQQEYVVAAKAMGASTPYLVRKHILPQLWGLLLASGMLNLAGTILAESTLSFLGIGFRPPSPSWGGMINTARGTMNASPLYLLWPSLMLSLTIFALNFVGDGLRAWSDPKRQ